MLTKKKRNIYFLEPCCIFGTSKKCKNSYIKHLIGERKGKLTHHSGHCIFRFRTNNHFSIFWWVYTMQTGIYSYRTSLFHLYFVIISTFSIIIKLDCNYWRLVNNLACFYQNIKPLKEIIYMVAYQCFENWTEYWSDETFELKFNGFKALKAEWNNDQIAQKGEP